MGARLTFLGIAAFWVTMNILLWRAEFGARGGDTPVPPELVWRRILTAPDNSSLSVYQNKERTGYCEIKTAVNQQMSTMDEDKPPPESFGHGYQINFAGNIAFGDFTNRLKFDGYVQFNSQRRWRELALKVITRVATVEIHSLETNQTARVKISADNYSLERDIAFADLQNPNAIVRAFAGNYADILLNTLDLPALPSGAFAQGAEWNARRTRIKIGSESVPVYELDTSVLGRPIVVDVSTLGEILRVQLPDNVTAIIDELNRP